jgi:hypothetical protein
MFSAPFQQGIHNAMRVLLHDIGQGELLLPGFRRLNPGDDEPALWITSVGRESPAQECGANDLRQYRWLCAAKSIGAFYDEEVHRYLKLTTVQGQVVYHFAIAYPVSDPRVEA